MSHQLGYIKGELRTSTKAQKVKRYFRENAVPIAFGAAQATAVILVVTAVARSNKDLLVLTHKQSSRLARGTVDGIAPGVEYNIRGAKFWLIPALADLTPADYK